MKRHTLHSIVLVTMLFAASTLQAQTYTFSILAGKPKVSGFKDGIGTNALFRQPSGLAIDSAGNLYVADTGNKAIREIQSDGTVTTLTNLQFQTSCLPSNWLSLVTNWPCLASNWPGFTSKKPWLDSDWEHKFSFVAPIGIAIDAGNNIYVSDNNQIYKLSGNIVSNLAGSVSGCQDGPRPKGLFNGPCALAVDADGDVWVADQKNAAVREISPDGTVTTIYNRSTNPPKPCGPKQKPASKADNMQFCGIALDSSNNVFLMDEENYIDSLIGTNGLSLFFSGGTQPCSDGLAVDKSGNVYFFDGASNQVVSVSQSGVVTVLGKLPITGKIEGIVLDAFNNIYLVDSENNVIIKGTPSFPAFFDGQAALSGGIYYLAFPDEIPFGYYNLGSFDFPLFYHYDMGFEYFFDANDNQSGGYLYDFSSQTFWYTSPAIFPYMYDFTLNAWLYYYPDTQNPGHYTTNPRYFYNFGTQQIITK